MREPLFCSMIGQMTPLPSFQPDISFTCERSQKLKMDRPVIDKTKVARVQDTCVVCSWPGIILNYRGVPLCSKCLDTIPLCIFCDAPDFADSTCSGSFDGNHNGGIQQAL
jgi:hypothetical protein